MRLIDADKLCDEVRKMADGYSCLVDCKIAGLLLKAPTIDSVKHGHWNTYSVYGHSQMGGYLELRYGCSCCAEWQFAKIPYCPNCGAKMDEVSE